MVTALVAAVLLSTPLTSGSKAYVTSGRAGSHSFTVRIETKTFSAGKKKVTWMAYGAKGTLGANRIPKPVEGVSYIPAYLHTGRLTTFWGYDTVPYEATEGLTAEAWIRKRGDHEIASIHVIVDGKNWPVARKFYDNMLDPNLGREYLSAKLSKDGKTLTVTASGSDGAGGYNIKWILRSNGRHKVDNEIGC
jgi:hypothetical protein